MVLLWWCSCQTCAEAATRVPVEVRTARAANAGRRADVIIRATESTSEDNYQIVPRSRMDDHNGNGRIIAKLTYT